MIKFLKTKDKALKPFKEKQHISYEGNQFSLGKTAFFSDIMEAKRKWHDIFQVLIEKNYLPAFLYSVKLSFKNKEE